jgi:hypothetical protein
MRLEKPSGALWHREQFCANTCCPRSGFPALDAEGAEGVRCFCSFVWLIALAVANARKLSMSNSVRFIFAPEACSQPAIETCKLASNLHMGTTFPAFRQARFLGMVMCHGGV